MSFLCDTNVIGELARPRPNAGVVAWASQVSTLTLSAVTIEEVFFGLAWKPHPRAQAFLERFLETRCQVLPVSEEVARIAGALRGRLQSEGRPRSQADVLIAATALLNGLTLVTRNQPDFEHCGVPVLNPFT